MWILDIGDTEDERDKYDGIITTRRRKRVGGILAEYVEEGSIYYSVDVTENLSKRSVLKDDMDTEKS